MPPPKKKTIPLPVPIHEAEAQSPPSGAARATATTFPPAIQTFPATTPATWQQVHDQLEEALVLGNESLDQAKGDALLVLNRTLDTLSAELTALNAEDIQSRTISLQAAEQQLGAGIGKLKTLHAQLDGISDAFANAAKVAQVVDIAVSGISSFLTTFPVL